MMNMHNFENAVVTEWSPSQKCFHVFSVKDMIEHNQRAFLRGHGGTDFIPIGIFESDEKADVFLKDAHDHRRKMESCSEVMA